MADEKRGSPIYKVIGFTLAGLIVAQAFIFLLILRPTLQRKTPADQITNLVAAQFPDSEPQVTGPANGVLRVSLNVPFDPTVDAERAHEVFSRVAAAASGPKLAGAVTLEVTLRGAGLEGGPTSATRTYDYEPGQPDAK